MHNLPLKLLALSSASTAVCSHDFELHIKDCVWHNNKVHHGNTLLHLKCFVLPMYPTTRRH